MAITANKFFGKKEKGGALATIPKAPLVSSPSGKLAEISEKPKETPILVIKTKVIKIEDLLKGTLAAEKKAADEINYLFDNLTKHLRKFYKEFVYKSFEAVYDLEKKQGSVFFLLDNLEKGVLSLMVISNFTLGKVTRNVNNITSVFIET